MRTLLVTTFTPTRGSGRATRTYGTVAALARLGPVDLLYQEFGADQPDPAYARLPDVSLHRVRASGGARRVLAVARARLRGTPLDLARSASPELEAAAHRLAEGADRIVADGPGAALAIWDLAARAIYSGQNVESHLDPRMARIETRMLARFSETWMATRADAGWAAAHATRVRYAPNVVDVEAIAPRTASPPGARILMVADYSYAPNREGAGWLAGDVMPRLWERRPDAELLLAGRGLDLVEGDPRIRGLGFVDDLDAAYADAAVVAVPLLRGSGSPLKLIEALAHGAPVVATAHATALLPEARDGAHLLAAADADAFAAALARVLDGDAAALGPAARALAEAEYSVAALTAALRAT